MKDTAEVVAAAERERRAAAMPLVITLPAPITARAPIRTPGQMMTPPPTHVLADLARPARFGARPAPGGRA